MKPNDEDVTMRALGRSAERDRAEVDARLADDPALADQLRDTEQLAVDVWQASSPLESPPPELWEEIESALAPREGGMRKFWLPVTAAVGWAAAVALLAVLLLRNPAPRETAGGVEPGGAQSVGRVENGSRSEDPLPSPRELDGTERHLRRQLAALQRQLREARARGRAGVSPNVLTLRSPGAVNVQTPEEREARVLGLLAAALEEDLRKRNEHPVDLIIEEGWDPGVFVKESELLIRHRDFRAATAGLEMMVAPNGDYYDPESGFVWSPAEDGGGYLGQAADANLDLESFAWVRREQDPAESRLVAGGDSKDPAQGYVIQDAETGVATLLLDGVSPVMSDGELFARFTNIDGIMMQQSISPTAMGDSSVITSSLERIDLSGGLVVGTSFLDGTEAILMNAGE